MCSSFLHKPSVAWGQQTHVGLGYNTHHGCSFMKQHSDNVSSHFPGLFVYVVHPPFLFVTEMTRYLYFILRCHLRTWLSHRGTSGIYFKVSFYLIILSYFRNFPVGWKPETGQEQGLMLVELSRGSTVLHISPPPMSSPVDKLHLLSVEDTEGYGWD